MKIIEQIRWMKLRKYVWDEELKQTCGEIKLNCADDEDTSFCFAPDKIYFDSEQLKKIIKILERENQND